MLWRSAARVPDRPAVQATGSSLSFEGLRARAESLGLTLGGSGTKPGDRVVILLERGTDAVASYFGVLAAGGVAVVLNDLLRPRQIEYVVEHAGASLLLTSSDVLRRMHRELRIDIPVVRVDEARAATDGATRAWEPAARAGSDPAQITYTSGSTGLPKGVVASHDNVWAAIETVAGYLGLREDDRIAGMLPFSGVYGANQMLCATLVGATLVVPRSGLMNDVARELIDAGATVLAAVPPLWTQLARAPVFSGEPIPTLRILQNAGGHLPPAVLAALRKAQPQARIFLQYGMTEVFRSAFLSPEEVDARPGSMGRPMPGAEILVVREDGSLCAPGEVGELVHSGPTVTLGYWNDPAKTAAIFRAHPVLGEGTTVVYSGDMVRRDEEGYLYFVGRRDRMIKTLGYRVGPDEILDALYASGEIDEGLVTAEEDDARGQRVVAYVVLKPGGSLDRLRKFSRAELPRYMQPTRFTVLESLPRLLNGKHDLEALRVAGAPGA